MTPASGLLIYCDIKDMGPDMVSRISLDFTLARNVYVLLFMKIGKSILCSGKQQVGIAAF
jgi:hypothetical protein